MPRRVDCFMYHIASLSTDAKVVDHYVKLLNPGLTKSRAVL